MAEKNEANIISYSVLINADGKIITESRIVEVDGLKGKLSPSILATLKTIIRIANTEFYKIHNKIERELDARIYKD